MITYQEVNTPSIRRLPIWLTVQRAYILAWQNRIVELRVLLIPLVLMVIGNLLQSRAANYSLPIEQFRQAFSVLHTPKGAMPTGIVPPLSFGIILNLVGLILLLTFNVSWQRHLLLKEKPSLWYFRPPFWRYTWVGILIFLSTFPVIFISTVLISIIMIVSSFIFATLKFSIEKIDIFLLIVPIGAIFFILLWWIYRHILLLTAAAVGNKNINWKLSRHLMNGSKFSYIIIGLVALFPLAFPFYILAGLADLCDIHNGGLGGGLIFSLCQSLMSAIQYILMSTIAALLYDYVVNGNGPGIAPKESIEPA